MKKKKKKKKLKMFYSSPVTGVRPVEDWQEAFKPAEETPMASDQDMADEIRANVQDLRDSIATARNAGLVVEIPLLLSHYLEHGTAPGEPAVWVIKRRSL